MINSGHSFPVERRMLNHETLHKTAVWACRLVGCVFIYAALFVTEDEEGGVQNGLELWLAAVRRRQDASISYVVGFMQGIAEIEKRAFDAFFGKKLLSIRSVLASVSLSIIVLTVTEATFDLLIEGTLDNNEGYYTVLIPLSVFCLGVLVVLQFSRSTWTHLFLAFLTLVAIFGASEWFWWNGSRSSPTLPEIHISDFSVLGIYLGLLAASCACDFLFIVFTRLVMKKISTLYKTYSILALIAVHVLLGIVLSGVYFYDLSMAIRRFDFRNQPEYNEYYYFHQISQMNSLDGLICLIWVLMFAGIVLHRLLWPSLWRPIYALKRFKVIQNKKLLWATAMVLLIGPAKGVSFVMWAIDKISKAG
jgi:hypothetical protein